MEPCCETVREDRSQQLSSTFFPLSHFVEEYKDRRYDGECHVQLDKIEACEKEIFLLYLSINSLSLQKNYLSTSFANNRKTEKNSDLLCNR